MLESLIDLCSASKIEGSPSTILIQGKSGSGKTYLLSKLMERLNDLSTVEVIKLSLLSYTQYSEKRLIRLLETQKQKIEFGDNKLVILIDDASIDILSSELPIRNYLKSLLDYSTNYETSVIIFETTYDNSSLTNDFKFKFTEILQMNSSKTEYTHKENQSINALTKLIKDKNLSHKLVKPKADQYRSNITKDAFNMDLLGYENVKFRLEQLIIWQWYHVKKMKEFNIQPVSGVLLYGPSGCGKTRIAKELSKYPSISFVSLKASDIFSKYLGQSESILRDYFKKARSLQPCVLFLDEIDSIASKRDLEGGGGSTSVETGVLATLLNEMDGVDSSWESGVLVLAATNRLEALDGALLRPGRLGAMVEVPLPNKSDCLKLLKANTQQHLHEGDFLNELSIACVQFEFTCFICLQLCERAKMIALSQNKTKVTHSNLSEGFELVAKELL